VRRVAILAVDRHVVRDQMIFPTHDEGLAIAVGEAATARRAAFVMDDDGGWLDPAGLAEPRLQPKTQVVVFLAIDKNWIEAMQRGKILGADRKASAADHRQRARPAEVRRIARETAV